MSYDFADRLIEMRRTRGLSQEELAKRLGLSRQAVSKWERAESAPDIGNLVALADIYDVTLDELVRGMDEAESEVAEVGIAEGQVEPSDEATSVEDAVVENVVEAKTEVEMPPPPNADDVVSTSADAQTMPPPPEGAVPIHPPVTPQAEPSKVRNPLYTFPYALLVALIYLVLGFVFGLWHPGWVIFLTIPFYYWIASVITHDPEFEAKHRQYYAPQDSHHYGNRGPSSE